MRWCLLVVVTSIVAMTLLVACGSSNHAAGGGCQSTADCAAGLSCISLDQQPVDGGCSSAALACSKTCTTDPDCTSLGASFKCFQGCAGQKFCGATQ